MAQSANSQAYVMSGRMASTTQFVAFIHATPFPHNQDQFRSFSQFLWLRLDLTFLAGGVP